MVKQFSLFLVLTLFLACGNKSQPQEPAPEASAQTDKALAPTSTELQVDNPPVSEAKTDVLSEIKGLQALEPQAFMAELDKQAKFTILDLRPTSAYVQGSVSANAGNVVYKDNPNFQAEFEEQAWASANPLFLVCGDGSASLAVAALASERGFKQIFVLRGGIKAWQAANLPLVKG